MQVTCPRCHDNLQVSYHVEQPMKLELKCPSCEHCFEANVQLNSASTEHPTTSDKSNDGDDSTEDATSDANTRQFSLFNPDSNSSRATGNDDDQRVPKSSGVGITSPAPNTTQEVPMQVPCPTCTRPLKFTCPFKQNVTRMRVRLSCPVCTTRFERDVDINEDSVESLQNTTLLSEDDDDSDEEDIST